MKSQAFLTEIKEKPIAELLKAEGKLRSEINQLRFGLAFGKVKNVSEIRKLGKNLARLKTIINQKLEEELVKAGEKNEAI